MENRYQEGKQGQSQHNSFHILTTNYLNVIISELQTMKAHEIKRCSSIHLFIEIFLRIDIHTGLECGCYLPGKNSWI